MQTHMVIRHTNCLMPFGYVCSIAGNEYINNHTSPDSITQEMHVWTEVCYLSTILYHHHHNHCRPFSGTIRWAGARRKPLLDCMVLGRITRGRHTNNPGGCHSIWTNQQSTSINPPSLRQLPFLPQPSQFILAWDKHRNMLDCIQYPWLGSVNNTQPCQKLWREINQVK